MKPVTRILTGALLLLGAQLLTMQALADGIHGQEVSYSDNGTLLEGYLAHDASATDARPGVLVIHEWWGHNEHAREQARRLARLGYVALAVDMYGDGQLAEHPDDAGQFASQIRDNRDLMLQRFQAADGFLRSLHSVDDSRIAAIGYCFGGSVVLEMARSGADLQAVASFHGSLGTEHPATAGEVQARILVLHGNDDPMVPPEQVQAFKNEMDAAGVDYRFVGYDGASHSFTNPDADAKAEAFGMPIGYDADADADSWAELTRLLAKTFGE